MSDGRINVLDKKSSGEVKGRLSYNSKPTREWILRDNKSSPTALMESILLTSGIDAREERDVASLDVPNTFIQTHTPLDLPGESTVMKVRGVLVNWLIKLEPVAYSKYVVYYNGKKILYLEILRAISWMLVTSLLWYRKLRKDLEEINVLFYNYDPCIAKRLINTHQQNI